MLEQFHFLRPAWLLALVPLIAVVWLMLTRKLGSRSWEAFCDATLLPYILAGGSDRRRRLPVVLTGLCGVLAIVALAGPVWDKLPQPVFSNQSSLVVALDLSRSMGADDISPSRLGRARFKIRDLLARRPDGRTALLVYAGDAFTVTPLTDDTKTIISQLQALSPEIMPVQGNRADTALRRAEELLQQAGAGRGHVLLITDDMNVERSVEAARELNSSGYQVSVMGVGTDHGVPIPLGDGSFLKDENGEIVMPTLKEKPLREVAAAGGGVYIHLQTNDEDINRLVGFFKNTLPGEMQATEMETDVWREQGPWLLLLLLPLAALAFRRGYILVLVCVILPLPQDAHALDWDSFWWRDDQRARQHMQKGEHDRAAELFRDPAWKGAAQYRGGDYAGAAESLQDVEGAENLYNLGNALAQTGRYQAAIEAYDKVLEQDPEHADARYNKQLVEEELKKQQQQQQQQQSQQQNQQEQDQKNKRPGDQDNKQDKNRKEGGKEPPEQDQEQQQQDPESGKQKSPDQKESQQKPEQEPSRRQKSDDQRGEQQEQQAQQQKQPAAPEDMQPDEQKQAVEQWLRRIPDDPGELLRRKFLYQYQKRQRDGDNGSW